MTIICLIGPSGSGKTTLAEALVPTGIETIRSFTTRPMRPGERNGREHIFVDEANARRLLSTQRPLAYTLFGGYRYFALWSQIAPFSSPQVGMTNPAAAPRSEGASRGFAPGSDPRGAHSSLLSYVIDELGYHTLLAQVIALQNEMKQDYHIDLPPISLLPVRIERSEEALADIDPARRARDADRPDSGAIPYRIVIHNDADSAIDLAMWAQTKLATALRVWLSDNTSTPSHHNTFTPSHLDTRMAIAEIIAHLNGAIQEVKR